MSRTAQIDRKTNETSISLALNLDGQARMSGQNPIPFFEHMLGHNVKYSMLDLELQLKADIEIDCHHSVEDTAIVFGQALQQSLGNKAGIFRYGSFTLPMDEVLTTVTLDLSGRPFLGHAVEQVLADADPTVVVVTVPPGWGEADL